MENGDLLYFWAGEQELIVAMANDKGARVYDIESPDFTDDGCIKTVYFTYEELDEACSYMGNVRTFAPK